MSLLTAGFIKMPRGGSVLRELRWALRGQGASTGKVSGGLPRWGLVPAAHLRLLHPPNDIMSSLPRGGRHAVPTERRSIGEVMLRLVRVIRPSFHYFWHREYCDANNAKSDLQPPYKDARHMQMSRQRRKQTSRCINPNLEEQVVRR